MVEPNQLELMPNSSSIDLGEDDWVIVKKQRVVIHIPPLAHSELPTVKNSEPGCLALRGVSEPPALENLSAGLPARKTMPLTSRCKMHSPELASASLLNPKPGARKVCPSRFRSSIVHPPTLPSRILDTKLRVANIDRKLTKAGGLNRWLMSLGLEQFIKIFHGRIVSRLQLANLSMKKLKDMGAHAVGPRRKLIHALDCLCQPYCFEHV